MGKSDKPLLNVLAGKPVHRTPIWLMRQAGRYLPEYRALRSQADSFLELCLTPEWASEVTLQPIRRFHLDAAILFADILLVPYALEQKLAFLEGEGPVLDPVRSHADLDELGWNVEMLEPVFETISRVKEELPEETALIGFSGGLWTVACYMIEGKGKTGFETARQIAETNPDFMTRLMDDLFDSTLEYLGRQIEAGVEVLQIFESHAGLLTGDQFRYWVLEPTRKLVEALKAEYGEIPIIGFPRGAAQKDLLAYTKEIQMDAIGIDHHVDLSFARTQLRPEKILQGNLDPQILVEGGSKMREAVDQILHRFGTEHIFNLGHGVVPETPPEHVAELVAMVRNEQG